MLRLENVVKRYPSFTLNCSLHIKEGMISGIVGLNGAGKSTLFKSILNLIHIDEGEIVLFNKSHLMLDSSDKEKIGVVIADSFLSDYLSIRDFLPMLKQMYHDFDQDIFIKQLSLYDLPLDKKIKDYSTGMKAKLKILIALSHKANLLILDEPTSGLDVIARESILNMLRDYMAEDESRAIIISSHISSDLEGLCDDIYMIDQGNIVLHEDTDVLLSDYGLLKLTDEQYQAIEHDYFVRYMKESYGYKVLTNQRQYYLDNYPNILIEHSNIDEMITLMIRGNE